MNDRDRPLIYAPLFIF